CSKSSILFTFASFNSASSNLNCSSDNSKPSTFSLLKFITSLLLYIISRYLLLKGVLLFPNSLCLTDSSLHLLISMYNHKELFYLEYQDALPVQQFRLIFLQTNFL